ncbi:MAG: energy-coupling factor transporter transmembrane component T [Ethanoligenens sp.]
MNSFKTYHPIVNFAFFVAVIICTLWMMHPVFLAISLLAAFLYPLLLKGARALRFNLLFALPMLVVIAVLNPLFVHQGMTMLFYINDNPITLEAILYGVAAAVMLVSVLLWFSSYNEVVTSDKFLYLFGRAMPSLALLLSMTLRLIPRLKTQIGRISQAQKAIGLGAGTGNVFQRARNGLRILSILITWALENAVETADSMKARGYGLHGRTAFSIFRFDRRDAACLAVIGAAAAVCMAGQAAGAAYVQYYPDVKWVMHPFTIVMAAAYALLCFWPAVLEIREGYKWRSLKSTI